jgi:hypothetical protein
MCCFVKKIWTLGTLRPLKITSRYSRGVLTLGKEQASGRPESATEILQAEIKRVRALAAKHNLNAEKKPASAWRLAEAIGRKEEHDAL